VHLAGWTDSGIAGQTAMGFLQARWNARTAATFDSDELIDYRARRPLIRLASGTIEAVSWSDVELSLGTTVNGLRDALVLTGPEPDFRWHAFADRVAELCRQLGVIEVFGLGAFPAPSLHTDPVAVVSHDLRAPHWILERGGSDVHPRCAGGQRGRDGFVVAQAAGQLHLDIH